MKEIVLADGRVTLVDDSDFESLNQSQWHSEHGRNTHYAVRYTETGGCVLMHRELLGLTCPRVQGEHKNGNGLDNRRENLRIATNRQNQQGFQTLRLGKSSQFRGVSKHRARWKSGIRVDGRLIYLGLFKEEVEAAKAYDRAALQHFGEFASPNFPESGSDAQCDAQS